MMELVRRSRRRRARLRGFLVAVCLVGLSPGCSEDMQQQVSVQAQEAPRRHSPADSVPRASRTVIDPDEVARLIAAQGRRLFAINCSHCHGPDGDGDGPAAGFLKELPANLRTSRVQAKTADDFYAVLTRGKDMMPSFRGELSATERRALAEFVATLGVRVGGRSDEP